MWLKYFMQKGLISFVIYLCIILNYTHAYAQKTYRVIEVHDGDTVTLLLDSFLGIRLKTQKARLIGIDAPELHQEPWGKKAKGHLQKLIRESANVVTVEFDVDKIDQYNRLLVYLRDKDGRLINELMVASGYAMIYTVPPNVKYSRLLFDAQQKAKSAKKGIWGKRGLKEAPSEFRHRHPR